MVLLLTPQRQFEAITPKVVFPVWGTAAVVGLLLLLANRRGRANTFALGQLTGAGTVLLVLLALLMVVLIICTGIVFGPMQFRE